MTVPFNDDIYYTESIAGYNWPPKLVQSSTNCGDPLNDDLYPADFTDTLSRIRSGYYPFGLEHSAYSNLLANAQINLDRCQNKLDCRVDVHETLEAHKQFLEAHIALISSLCSPIRKLPRELLEDIFEYVCCTGVSNHIAPRARYFSEDFRRRDLSHVARLSTLDLGQVCHYWNSIICSLPVLWSSFGFQEMKKSIVVKSGLELFLRRSSSHPIDLLINEFSNQLLICEDGGGEPGDVVFEDQEDIDQVDKAEDFIQLLYTSDLFAGRIYHLAVPYTSHTIFSSDSFFWAPISRLLGV
ncbi:hypothetical protein LENED_006891 [Lentinula edodes]|uniref:Uncharacterized protein n=1 Tax=Lentinula edodes TaxID=5353 RepID=A0A1Q3ECZ2_LENED|nr:hypothetical protein LENED_006891 [Lentinula edodes]